jgi:hypothetical protein
VGPGDQGPRASQAACGGGVLDLGGWRSAWAAAAGLGPDGTVSPMIEVPWVLPEVTPLPQDETVDGRRFPCPLPGCNGVFKTHYGLERHWRSHTGEKRFQCPFPDCDRAYAHRPGLDYHLAAVHTGPRRFKCDFPGCPATFPGASSLKLHAKVHYPGSEDDGVEGAGVAPGPRISEAAVRADGGGGGGGASGGGGAGGGGGVRVEPHRDWGRRKCGTGSRRRSGPGPGHGDWGHEQEEGEGEDPEELQGEEDEVAQAQHHQRVGGGPGSEFGSLPLGSGVGSGAGGTTGPAATAIV